MKTLFIQASKYLFIVTFLSFIFVPIAAQDLAEALFGKGSKVTYMGQYNYNGKRKNGFGIERYNNGSLYIGDFLENKITGRGMLYSPKKGISNVSGGAVFIGNFMNGKKQGRGTCYDKNGKMIFMGMFNNDKPAKEGKTSGKRFSVISNNKGLYCGESVNNIPNGFGLLLQNDGIIIFGTTQNGKYEGVGMKLYTPELWEVGRWDNEIFSSFSDSETSKNNIATFRATNKAGNKAAWGCILEATQNFAQAGLTTTTMVNDIKQGGSNDGENIGRNGTATPGGSHKGKGLGKCKSCGGSGTCSPSSGSGRKNACHGSGLCGYCSGTGWINAGGSKAVCKACNGSGKCKSCKGTGKCSKCHGTGN